MKTRKKKLFIFTIEDVRRANEMLIKLSKENKEIPLRVTFTREEINQACKEALSTN